MGLKFAFVKLFGKKFLVKMLDKKSGGIPAIGGELKGSSWTSVRGLLAPNTIKKKKSKACLGPAKPKGLINKIHLYFFESSGWEASSNFY